MQKNTGSQSEIKFMQKAFKFYDVAATGTASFDQFLRTMEKVGVVMSKQ